MALKKTYKLDNGLTAKDSYTKIDRIEAYNDYVIIHGSIFANKTARDEGKPPVKRIAKKIDIDNSAFIPMAYEALKSDSEFSDATDV